MSAYIRIPMLIVATVFIIFGGVGVFRTHDAGALPIMLVGIAVLGIAVTAKGK